ncbi:hypothetical protein MKX08_005240 [Trichoderma sp. CBMAI-0020]|nr:hypothetical protein MKX08_005240 [Trichoderma sp. CBMAI-0020]
MSREGGIFPVLKSLLLQDKYSDLTIICGGQEFKAHRAIVCPQSPFFAAACDNGLKESSTGVIELPEDNPEILIRFLQFLYTGNYEDGEYSTQDKPAPEASTNTDEVRRELGQAPGVVMSGLSRENQHASPRTQIQTVANDGDDGHDEDYKSSSPNTEPDEEYSSGSEDEKVDGDPNAEYHAFVDNRTISLLMSLRLYVMADKFGVPALQLLSRRRFYSTAQEVFLTYSEFSAVIDELYETTAPTDYIIREIPCRLIAAGYASQDFDSTGFETLMRKHVSATMDNHIDQATLDLIIQLQLQDTQTLIKGKHREGEQSDVELAAELYRLELESLVSFQHDHTMSRSIAHAVLADGELINEHVLSEEQAMRDREIAIQGEYPEQISRTTTPETVMNEEMIKKLTALYIGNAEPLNGEPSSRQAATTMSHSSKVCSAPARMNTAVDA